MRKRKYFVREKQVLLALLKNKLFKFNPDSFYKHFCWCSLIISTWFRLAKFGNKQAY